MNMSEHPNLSIVRPSTVGLTILILVGAILVPSSALADPPPDDIDPAVYTEGPRWSAYHFGDTIGPHSIRYDFSEYFPWFWNTDDFPLLEEGVNNLTIPGEGAVFWLKVPHDESLTITQTGDEQLPDMSGPRGAQWVPTDGDTTWWVVDKDANAVLQVTEAGEVSTVYDGAELDQPHDLVFLRNDNGDQVCIVSSAGNSQLVVLDLDGGLITTITHANIVEPFGLTRHEKDPRWAFLADGGSDSILALQFKTGPAIDVSVIRQGDPVNNPRGITHDAIEDQIFFTNDGEWLVVGMANWQEPSDLAFWDTTPVNKTVLDPVDVAMVHPRMEYSWPGRQLLIADRGKNRILRLRDMNVEDARVFADEIPGLRTLSVFPMTRDAFVVTDNDDGNSLIGFPYDVTVRLDVAGDSQIVAFRENQWGDTFGDMEVAVGSDEDKRLHFAARRGEDIAVWMRSPDPSGEPESVDLTLTLSPLPLVWRPMIEVNGGPDPGEIQIDVFHDNGLGGDSYDELTVYQLMSCGPVDDLLRNIDLEELGENGESWDPPFFLEEGSMRHCLQEITTVSADADGDTSIILDGSVGAWPQAGGYCFVVRGKDTDSGFMSRLSPFTMDSCGAPQVGTSQGTSCDDPFDVLEGLENDFKFNRFGAHGESTWYRYTVPEPEGSQHILVTWTHFNSNFSSMIDVFTSCGSEPVQSAPFIFVVGTGGQDIYLRVTEFGELPYNTAWQFLDFEVYPDTNLDPASNLTASTDQEGQITLCWDDPETMGGWKVSESMYSYNIYSRPSGEEDFNLYPMTWWGTCFIDTELTPGVPLEPGDQKDYYVTFNVPYASDMPNGPMEGPPSGGTTGQVAVGDSGPTLETPGSFDSLFPEEDVWMQLVDFFVDTFAVQVTWDEDPFPHGFLVESYSLGDGEASYAVFPGGKYAGYVQPRMLDVECHSAWSFRMNGEDRVYSDPAGYRGCSGDDCVEEHCINLCEEATEELWLWDYNQYGNQCGEGEVDFSVDVGLFVLENAEAGPYYAASFWGVPMEICAYEGSWTCQDLQSRGCAQPGTDGNTVHTFSLTGGSNLYLQLTRQIPVADLPMEFTRGIDFEYGRGLTVPPPELPRVSVSIPDGECGGSIPVTYSLDNMPADYVDKTVIALDNEVVATLPNASGTHTIDSVTSGVDHYLEVRTYFTGHDQYWRRLLIFNRDGIEADTNSDCALNVLDVIKVLNHILGVELLPDAVRDSVDLTGGGIETTDLVAMVTRILS